MVVAPSPSDLTPEEEDSTFGITVSSLDISLSFFSADLESNAAVLSLACGLVESNTELLSSADPDLLS